MKSEPLDLNEIMASLPGETRRIPPETEELPADSQTSLVIPRNLNLSLNTELQKVLFEKDDLRQHPGRDAHGRRHAVAQRTLAGGLRRQGLGFGKLLDGCRSRTPALSLDADFANASFQQTSEQLEMVQQLVPIFAKTGGDYSLSLHLQTLLDAQMSPDSRRSPHRVRSARRTSTSRISRHSTRWPMRWATTACARSRQDVAIRLPSGSGRITTEPFGSEDRRRRGQSFGIDGLDQTIDYQAAKVAIPGGAVSCRRSA